MKKLIIVTVRFRGKVCQKMVNATQNPNGTFSVPETLINDMAHELGATGDQTIQIG